MQKVKDFVNKIELPKLAVLILGTLILYSVFVRVQGLGYSNFQGDEINPMTFLHQDDVNLLEYLLSQKRGPMQYVVNYVNVSLFGYHGEGQIRFPFLIFGVVALYVMYRLALKILKDPTAAFFATVLMSINGLFIAFARITQYQSFMYLVVPIGVLVFIYALEKADKKKMLIAGLLLTLALLAHYDTLSVVPFFVSAFVGYMYRKMDASKSLKSLVSVIKKYAPLFLIFFVAFLIPALAYYIPFYMGDYFSDTTSGYLENRLLGGGLMPRTKITVKLLRMYIPRFHLYSLFGVTALGLLWQVLKIDKFKLPLVSFSKNLMRNGYIFLVFLLVFATAFSFFHTKPRLSSALVIGSSMAISAMLTFSRKVDWKFAAVSTWFLGAFSFYFFIMKDPRTHVYVSFIPMFILAAYGFIEFYRMIKNAAMQKILLITTIAAFLFVSGVNWVIFVDKSPEYPWWDKDFLGIPIYRIKKVRHEKIEGVFGFNNYRGWEQMADLYERGCLEGPFNSNEKDSITSFYMPRHQQQGGLWDLLLDADTIIYVEGPHSWVYRSRDDISPVLFKLIHTIESKGVPVAYIYGHRNTYPEGKMLCD